MQLRTFDALLSFMLGAVWAFIGVGALITYSLFSFLGFWLALVATSVFLFCGFLIILLLEALLMFRRSDEEKRKQTRLLEEIHARLVLQKAES